MVKQPCLCWMVPACTCVRFCIRTEGQEPRSSEKRGTDMGKPVVEIQNLSKIFKRDSFEIPALENINLVIEEGEFLCLMGPSGSGKTTLLNIIAGIDRPTSGELRVLNEDVARVSEDRL